MKLIRSRQPTRLQRETVLAMCGGASDYIGIHPHEPDDVALTDQDFD